MNKTLESLLRLSTNSDGKTDWTSALRRDARRQFEELGVPTRRLEEWKGTNFAPLAALQFGRVGPHADSFRDAAKYARDPGNIELVFVDGRIDRDASHLTDLPTGVRLESLADVLDRDPELVKGRLATLTDLKLQSLVALQTAFFDDGAVLIIEEGAQIDRPLLVRFISTIAAGESSEAASASFPRLIVIAGEKSRATLAYEHICVGPENGVGRLPTAPPKGASGFTAFVAEFFLAANAAIETVQIQAEDARRIHFTSVHARLSANACFNSHVFSLGNGLVRSELSIGLVEPGAETMLCGLLLGRDGAHLDHFTTVDHAAENCTSDEEYRGVLADRSKGVFRGRVIVRPGAQKTDARQSNPNLLLSDKASIDTKPQLEIYADDIRASHGSTIGQLDADAIFFLRARGIDSADARRLLTGAFANGIVRRISSESLREIATSHVEAALAQLEASSIHVSNQAQPNLGTAESSTDEGHLR